MFMLLQPVCTKLENKYNKTFWLPYSFFVDKCLNVAHFARTIKIWQAWFKTKYEIRK